MAAKERRRLQGSGGAAAGMTITRALAMAGDPFPLVMRVVRQMPRDEAIAELNRVLARLQRKESVVQDVLSYLGAGGASN